MLETCVEPLTLESQMGIFHLDVVASFNILRRVESNGGVDLDFVQMALEEFQRLDYVAAWCFMDDGSFSREELLDIIDIVMLQIDEATLDQLATLMQDQGSDSVIKRLNEGFVPYVDMCSRLHQITKIVANRE